MSVPNTYLDNSSTPAPSTNVGFKISKPGYNAQTTAGKNLIFNSSWPSLPIAFETTLTNPIINSSSTAVIPHGLSFAPFTMGWYYATDPSGIVNTSSRFSMRVDKTNIYLDGNQQLTVPFTAQKIKIRAYQIDLSQDINYTIGAGDSVNSPYDKNFGIKVIKSGKNINSKDMRDYVLHSRCQSPLIQAVKTEKTSNAVNQTVVQYTSKLSYPVWVYGFVKNGVVISGSLTIPAGNYSPAPYYSQAYPRTITDGFISYVPYLNLGSTLVVLRDPMFTPNIVTVKY